MTNIIEKLISGTHEKLSEQGLCFTNWEPTVRAVLQTLHDNITPEMERAAADEINFELPAMGMRGAIQEAIATALKGERA